MSTLNNRHPKSWVVCGMLIGLLFSVTACGSTKQELELALRSTNRLNTTQSGQPAPVVVRIYTLRAKDRFEQATFQELWKHDYDFLGDDLLHRKEITVKPDNKHELEITADREKEENYVGLMALFRKHQPGMWRTVIPIEEPGFFSFGTPEFHFRLDQNSIRPVEPN